MQRREEAKYSDDGEEVSNKRVRMDGESSALVSVKPNSMALTTTSINQRKSDLMAPEVSLIGHEGAIYSMSFDPEGQHLCSGSFDTNICKKKITHTIISRLLEVDDEL